MCAEYESCTSKNDCQEGSSCIKGCCPSGRCFPVIEAEFPFITVASARGRMGAATVAAVHRKTSAALASDSADIVIAAAAPAVDAMGGLAAAVEGVMAGGADVAVADSAAANVPAPVVESPLPAVLSDGAGVAAGAEDVVAAEGGVSNLVPVTMHGGTSDASATAGDSAEDASGR
jgi:hypothetical protein